jgi:hypothetical protein
LVTHSELVMTHEEWRARFEELLAAIPATDAVNVDDSRESIYEGRGEVHGPDVPPTGKKSANAE